MRSFCTSIGSGRTTSVFRCASKVEVASLIGDVAVAPSGAPALHVHIVVGKRDGTAMAGHLGKAHVHPTLEVILTESPVHLQKVKHPDSGLALIRPEARS